MGALRYSLVLIALAACSKKAAKESASAAPAQAAPAAAGIDASASAPAPTGTGTAAAPPTGDDLLSLSSGVIPVDGPGGAEPTAREWALIDGDLESGWAKEEDAVFEHPIVLELPARVRIKTLVVDDAQSQPEALAHAFDIQVSDQSATAGFRTIAHITPDKPQDGISFPVTADVPGRWVRIVALPRANPDEGWSLVKMMNLHAYGERLAPTPTPQVTGTYQTSIGEFFLTQNGVQVTGCAEHGGAPFSGVIDGRVLRMQYTGAGENDHGPLIFIFGDGGHQFGAYWNEATESATPTLLPLDPERTSPKPGSCAQDTDPLAKQLEATGRVRLYGINFDTDKDVIRPESKPTLDQVIALLQGAPGLRLRIEGHTDDRGAAAHNQQLSEARAASVKKYLVDAGIAGDRLETQGFGATKPAASNASELGRAANRRVELAKL